MTAPKKIPPWLLRQLEEKHPASFGRLARWKICGRCGAVTLTGWDAYYDYAGQVTADPHRLNTRQELDALLAGRETFELRTDSNGGKTLSSRDHHRIRASPATGHRWPVIPQHKCGAPIGRKMEPREIQGTQNAQAAQENRNRNRR